MPRLPEKATTEDAQSAEDLGPYAENRRGLSPKVWQLQQKLFVKAKREPRFRFYALYDRIYRRDVLWNAWCRVAAHDGAPGVDGVTIASLAADESALMALLEGLAADLRGKTYRPAAVRRSYVAKANGKLRPLGIPTVRDRIAQMAALLVIEPIFEADFLPCSHGFRPGRKAHDAVDEIKQAVDQGRIEVLDADLSSYFDTIPHGKLLACVRKRISDGSVLRLIKLWLNAPIVEEGQPPSKPTQGTPQGGVLSPLLANVYLHWLDKLFAAETGPGTWANARLIRYADDFVICARFIGRRITSWLEELMDRMELTINPEKTTVVRLDHDHAAVDFLGFSLRRARSKYRGRFCVVTPSARSVTRAMRRLGAHTDKQRCFVSPTIVVRAMNAYLRGWNGYFNHGYASHARRKVDWHARNVLKRHMQRRSQRPFRPPKGVTWYQHLTQRMGLVRIAALGRGADTRSPWESRMLEICMSGSRRAPAGP